MNNMNNKQTDTIFTYLSHQQTFEPNLNMHPSYQTPSQQEVMEVLNLIGELLVRVTQLGLRNHEMEYNYVPPLNIGPHHQHGPHTNVRNSTEN